MRPSCRAPPPLPPPMPRPPSSSHSIARCSCCLLGCGPALNGLLIQESTAGHTQLAFFGHCPLATKPLTRESQHHPINRSTQCSPLRPPNPTTNTRPPHPPPTASAPPPPSLPLPHPPCLPCLPPLTTSPHTPIPLGDLASRGPGSSSRDIPSLYGWIDASAPVPSTMWCTSMHTTTTKNSARRTAACCCTHLPALGQLWLHMQ